MDSQLEYMGITGVFPTVITARIFSKSRRYSQIAKIIFYKSFCCNQVEMSPVLQSRNVTKCAEGSKAFEPGDFNYRRAEKPCGDQ
jgi:hypothetical protein